MSMSPALGKVTIEIDYSLDDNGFFAPLASNAYGFDGDAARTAMERAARNFSDRLMDHLTEMTTSPYPGVNFNPKIYHPATGAQYSVTSLTTVPENVLKIYAGGRDLSGSTLGQGGAGWGVSYYPGVPESELTAARGQSGGEPSASPHTDFGPWGGSITFDTYSSSPTVRNWYFGLDKSGLTAGKSDFFSVATHELAHVLGFGSSSKSFPELISGTSFTGPKSAARYGGDVPMDSGLAHWDQSVNSTYAGAAQQAAMTPSITVGTRKYFTLLDWAGLDDLGWDLARPGDANADGAVNFADLVLVSQNYRKTDALWSMGDFNYDGTVNFADLVTVSQNYKQTGPDPGLLSASFAQYPLSGEFASDWAAAMELTQAPEPGGIWVLAAAGAMLLARRRRVISR